MSCSTSSSVRGHPVCTAVVLTRCGGGVVQVAHEFFCCIGSSSKSLACIPSQGGAGGAAVGAGGDGGAGWVKGGRGDRERREGGGGGGGGAGCTTATIRPGGARVHTSRRKESRAGNPMATSPMKKWPAVEVCSSFFSGG